MEGKKRRDSTSGEGKKQKEGLVGEDREDAKK